MSQFANAITTKATNLGNKYIVFDVVENSWSHQIICDSLSMLCLTDNQHINFFGYPEKSFIFYEVADDVNYGDYTATTSEAALNLATTERYFYFETDVNSSLLCYSENNPDLLCTEYPMTDSGTTTIDVTVPGFDQLAFLTFLILMSIITIGMVSGLSRVYRKRKYLQYGGGDVEVREDR